MHTRLKIAIAAMLALAGCSGGSVDMDTEEPITEPEFLAAVASASSPVSGLHASLGNGFVHTNPNVSGVNTVFGNGRAVTTISRDGSSDITLDTNDSVHGLRPVSLVHLPGRSGQYGYVFEGTPSSATGALIAVDWSDSDPGDYLAAGYWAHVQHGVSTTFEYGAFVGGPELDPSSPPAMRTAGTASYQGTAGGLYRAYYGSDTGPLQGSRETGTFVGIASLTANFGDGTISGCLGCAVPIQVSGYHFDPSGAASDLNRPLTYRLHMDAASIDRTGGTFQGSDARFTGGEIPIVSTEGEWTGRFSNRSSDGDPRLVAGTAAGEGTTAGGSTITFLGAFAGGKQ